MTKQSAESHRQRHPRRGEVARLTTIEAFAKFLAGAGRRRARTPRHQPDQLVALSAGRSSPVSDPATYDALYDSALPAPTAKRSTMRPAAFLTAIEAEILHLEREP